MLLSLLWCAIAWVTSAAFLFKLTLFVLTAGSVAWLTVLAVFVLLYILFLAEGLQVAALYIKEHSLQTIDQYVQDKGYADVDHISFVAEKFIHDFDAFITGRQIIVITSVISFATLLNSMQIGEITVPAVWDPIVQAIESPYFVFMFSIFLPAWFSQLMPQFAANNRALSFITLPWSYSIIKLTLMLNTIGAGIPARKMLTLLQYLGVFNDKQSLIIEHQNNHAHLVQFEHQDLISRTVSVRHNNQGTRFEESFELKLTSAMPDVLRLKLSYKGISNIRLNDLDAGDTQHLKTSIEALADPNGRYMYVLLVQKLSEDRQGIIQITLSYDLCDRDESSMAFDFKHE